MESNTKEILDLIIKGLVQMQEKNEITNDFFKLGIDKLAYHYFKNDKNKYEELKKNYGSFISKKLLDWDLGIEINDEFGEYKLFNVQGNLSSFCEEYLRAFNIPTTSELAMFSQELEQRKILDFLKFKNQDLYIFVRKFIIENKYLEKEKFEEVVLKIEP